MTIRTALIASSIAAAAVLTATAAFANSSVLAAGDSTTMSHWYGRAGGLVGADEVAAVASNSTNPRIAVTFDRDVAARTNMPMDRASGREVSVTYDQAVAERTNMGLRETGPVHAASMNSTKSN